MLNVFVPTSSTISGNGIDSATNSLSNLNVTSARLSNLHGFLSIADSSPGLHAGLFGIEPVFLINLFFLSFSGKN